jgi:hypothetical protein
MEDNSDFGSLGVVKKMDGVKWEIDTKEKIRWHFTVKSAGRFLYGHM